MATTALQTTFGNWTINPTACTLEIAPADSPHAVYQVPLEEMGDSAAILDWIFQLNEKTWVTAADVGHFVEAIEYLFGRGVAGGGMNSPFDPKPILEQKLGCQF